MHQDEATYEIFNKLEHQDAALAERCFPIVQPLLVNHQEYERCLKYLGDVQAAFDRLRHNWEMHKQSEGQWEENMKRMQEITRRAIGSTSVSTYRPPQPPKTADKRFVDQTCQLVEILVGSGHKVDAEKIRDQALALLENERLKSSVADAERKLEKK
jgi:hypothetical protein